MAGNTGKIAHNSLVCPVFAVGGWSPRHLKSCKKKRAKKYFYFIGDNAVTVFF